MKLLYGKNHRKLLCTAAAAAYILSGCTQLDDSLPDSYYMTDTRTDISETSAASEVTETTVQTPAEASLPAAPTETSDTETQTSAASSSVTSVTSSETTAAPSETTASSAETAPTESETSAPPETTALKPQITIVTVPTAEQTSVAADTAASETETQSYYAPQNYYALNFDRQKAVWVSYLEYERIMRSASEAEFTDSLGTCFDNIAALGCNTVYFQVRAYGDAYYDSSLFPKGDRLTGDYDPLEIAVKAAHDRGLSIHAWVNPMRLMTDPQMKEVSSEYKIGEWYSDDSKNGTYIVNSSGRWYLNPAYPETVQLICDGISEIVTGYKVDGIQIDDYFYPTTDGSFDKAAYDASTTALSLEDWRRENATSMVKKIYRTVHEANSTAVFGISPQGNADSDYNTLYADVYRWTSEAGCCDYICPQIYYGFENASLPYTETVDLWHSMIKQDNIDLVIGLAAYKSGLEDKYAGDGRYEWQNSTDILSRQRDVTDLYGAGYAYFRYDSLFLPEPSVAASVKSELEKLSEYR